MNAPMMDVQITSDPLNAEQCRLKVADPSAGAQVFFTGAVRNHNKGKTVRYLDYEAYTPMALREMQRIAERAVTRFNLVKLALHHRTGELQIGDLAVVVAVSAHHRGSAFEACAYVIDELKKDVPIWKREVYENGEAWISERP